MGDVHIVCNVSGRTFTSLAAAAAVYSLAQSTIQIQKRPAADDDEGSVAIASAATAAVIMLHMVGIWIY